MIALFTCENIMSSDESDEEWYWGKDFNSDWYEDYEDNVLPPAEYVTFLEDLLDSNDQYDVLQDLDILNESIEPLLCDEDFFGDYEDNDDVLCNEIQDLNDPVANDSQDLLIADFENCFVTQDFNDHDNDNEFILFNENNGYADYDEHHSDGQDFYDLNGSDDYLVYEDIPEEYPGFDDHCYAVPNSLDECDESLLYYDGFEEADQLNLLEGCLPGAAYYDVSSGQENPYEEFLCQQLIENLQVVETVAKSAAPKKSTARKDFVELSHPTGNAETSGSEPRAESTALNAEAAEFVPTACEKLDEKCIEKSAVKLHSSAGQSVFEENGQSAGGAEMLNLQPD